MHTLGKVLVWLTALLAIGAVALSAKLLGVRNGWMEQVAALSAENTANAEKIESLRKELNQQRSELARTLNGWDRYWNNVRIQVANPEEGIVQADNLGKTQGLGTIPGQETPTVYLFRPTAEGGYVFVGPFTATTVQENSAAFKSTWKPRGSEAEQWVLGDWRVRGLIPASYVDRFVDLQARLTVSGDELLKQKQHNLDIQTQLIDTAQRDLQFRMEELQGADGNGGLVGAIRAEEEERNAELAEVDRLRRALKSRLSMQDQLIEENREISNKLPQPNRDVANVPGK